MHSIELSVDVVETYGDFSFFIGLTKIWSFLNIKTLSMIIQPVEVQLVGCCKTKFEVILQTHQFG